MTEVTWRTGRGALPLLAAVLALWGPSARAQDPAAAPDRPLTVAEAVRLGLANNPRVRGADADAAAGRAAEREARSALLPAVRSAATYTRIGGDIPAAEFMLPGVDSAITLMPVELDRYHLELSVEQPLYTGGRLRQGARAAGLEADAAERLAEQERADVAFEIRRAYWTLYGALSGRRATDAALAGVEAHLEDVRSRFDEGAALRSELLAARTRRSEILLERVESENAVRVARLELNRLTGLPLSAQVALSAAVEAEPLPTDLDALTASAAAALPRLRAMRAQVEALRAQVAATQGGRLPELAFLGRYIYARPNPYAFSDPSTFRGTWEAGLQMQWGLWEGGARSARVERAAARLRSAEAELETARREVEVEVARRYLEVRRATEALGVAAENVEEAEESLRVVRQQFREGAALSAEVLDAEHAYQQARARRARAEAEYGTARAALLHARGSVW